MIKRFVVFALFFTACDTSGYWAKKNAENVQVLENMGLTKIVHHGQRPCERYWADGEGMSYDALIETPNVNVSVVATFCDQHVEIKTKQ